MPSLKIEFCDSYNKVFHDVTHGDAQDIDNRLYIRAQYIPIREDLVKYAYAEINKGLYCGGYKYYHLYFKILPDRRFLSRYERHNNTLALVLNSAASFGAEERWRCPYPDEELRYDFGYYH